MGNRAIAHHEHGVPQINYAGGKKGKFKNPSRFAVYCHTCGVGKQVSALGIGRATCHGTKMSKSKPVLLRAMTASSATSGVRSHPAEDNKA